jgi:hypothetical protein
LLTSTFLSIINIPSEPITQGVLFDPNKYKMTIIDSGAITVIAKLNKFDTDSIPDPYAIDSDDSEEHIDEVVAFIEEPQDPSKTGPKNKRKLVAVEVYGYEVGRGRGKRIVLPKHVYELAVIGCSDREIARWYDLDENTLRYNFSDIIQKGREDLKHTLRRAMIKNALGGNAALQIFLAKNMLGMSDTPHDSEANQPLPWTEKDL